MIEYVSGDMFKSGADCLINTVNCEGYMGKGIAYQFKMRYPENNKDYVRACRNGQLKIGSIHCFVENDVTIVNFPTKDRWREKSKMRYIEIGMSEFMKILPSLGVKKIAIAPLGCGNGGLEWSEVNEVIYKYIVNEKDNYQFMIFQPSLNYIQKPKQAPKMFLSSLVVMQLAMKLNDHTKIRLQKAAFLMNYFYGDDYFKFDKYKYGPYSHALDLIIRDIGEYQKYYNLSSTEEIYEMVYRILCSDKIDSKLEKFKSSITKATNFINVIKTSKETEEICTVFYLIQNGEDNTTSQIIRRFKDWSDDKANRFSESDIKNYIQYLEDTNMICLNIVSCFEVVKR